MSKMYANYLSRSETGAFVFTENERTDWERDENGQIKPPDEKGHRNKVPVDCVEIGDLEIEIGINGRPVVGNDFELESVIRNPETKELTDNAGRPLPKAVNTACLRYEEKFGLKYADRRYLREDE